VSGLIERGVDARVWDLSRARAEAVERDVVAARPCLVHAFHALRAGPLAAAVARQLRVPYVVTLTGTDVNHDLAEPDTSATVRHVLDGAAAITVFHRSIAGRVTQALSTAASRVVVIPQAVRFARHDPVDAATSRILADGQLLVLFPGGIRHVKNPRVVLSGLEPLIDRHPGLVLAYAGPILDVPEGQALLDALGARPWARHLGAVPHTQMAALLGRADVVVNSSLSEGGMANSVLEALTLGRAVLASAIEGNRSLIEHDVTGLLFRDQAELTTQAERLLGDPALRARLGAAGRALVERDYPPHREIDAYIDLYRSLGLTLPR
jgi:glycosyltransferase involved in cell wall biosynthesis